MSVGKGKRSGRCICGKPTCGDIDGVSLGKNGWDRYSPVSTHIALAGEGYCHNYKELAHASSPLQCYQLGLADSACGHDNKTSVSVGKGKRSSRCICGLPSCGGIVGIQLGANGWDRYSLAEGPPPEPTEVMAVRYAWANTPCDYLNCSVYSKDGQLPAAPFHLRVSESQGAVEEFHV